jgi:hypothetical protein
MMQGRVAARVMMVMLRMCADRRLGIAQDDGRASVGGGQHETGGNEGAKE